MEEAKESPHDQVLRELCSYEEGFALTFTKKAEYNASRAQFWRNKPQQNPLCKITTIPRLAELLKEDLQRNRLRPNDVARYLGSTWKWPADSVRCFKMGEVPRSIRLRNDHLWSFVPEVPGGEFLPNDWRNLIDKPRIVLHRDEQDDHIFYVCRFFGSDEKEMYERFLWQIESRFANHQIANVYYKVWTSDTKLPFPPLQ